MKTRILWFFMGFPGFSYFWQNILRNWRKSSGGGCARPKKRRSSPSGGAKVVSGVIFLSADMFRSRADIHFFLGETLFLDPPSPGKVNQYPPPPSSRPGGGCGILSTSSGPAPAGVSPTKNRGLFRPQTCLRTKIRRQRQLFCHQMCSNGAFWVSRTRRHYFSGHFGGTDAKSMDFLKIHEKPWKP